MKNYRYAVALDGSENSIRALVEMCALVHDGDEVNCVVFVFVFCFFCC
jgi:hypothetical protein